MQPASKATRPLRGPCGRRLFGAPRGDTADAAARDGASRRAALTPGLQESGVNGLATRAAITPAENALDTASGSASSAAQQTIGQRPAKVCSM